MRIHGVITGLIAGLITLAGASAAEAAPCMTVTLTGTKGGPAAVAGLAGPGTLVSYGDDADDCGAVRLQFDAGRATSVSLSRLGINAGQLSAVFLTHVHSDHTDGLSDLMQLRWHYHSQQPKVDLVCAADAVTALGFTISCAKLAAHIADAFIASGEIAQRHAERRQTPAAGPAAVINTMTFQPRDEPQPVWSSGVVRVSAIRSTHMTGHASYRVDTPAGSVVIGGDASNDTMAPPRTHSTSDQVEKLAKGVDILVHTTTHPNMGPDRGGGMPPPIFFRQSNAIDLGAMAQRAGARIYMATHLTPALGETTRVDNWKIAGGPLQAEDFRQAIAAGGFTGRIIIGEDLTSVRLPAK